MTEPLRICRIVYEMPPPWDGLTPHPYEVTRSQAKRGYLLDVFCGRWPKSGPTEYIKNVTYHTSFREPYPGTINLTSSIDMLFKYLFWRSKNTPDIIHSHGHFALWLYFYRNFLRKYLPWHSELKIPLVVHFHNTAKGRWESMEQESKYIAPHSKYLAWPLMVWSDKLAVKVASACIFVSQELKNDAIKYYSVDERRSFVIESGVNPELFKPISELEKDKSRKDMDLDHFDKVIVYVGFQVERKNTHLLVEALSKLPGVYKLLLVGQGDPAYIHTINEKINALGLMDRVIKTGYTPYPLVPIAYQVADIFVLPSSWEGLPKVAMESLACGVPVLANGFKLSLDIKGIFYLSDLDPQTIANNILQITSIKQEVEIQKVILKYSWDERVIEIGKVYEFAKQNTLI